MKTSSRYLRPLLAVVAMAASMPVLAGAYEDILVAARDNRTETVIDFVQRGMDVNTSDVAGTTLLMYAAGNGNNDILEFLLANRANIQKKNKYGDTAIGFAALKGHLDIVRRLVKAGAVINNGTWTPLHYAAFAGHLDIVNYLIAQRARVDALAPNGQTPLMLAAKNGYFDVVKALAATNADLDIDDPSGNTALGIALNAGNTEIANYLRNQGADE
jgi:hypothetical protein